MNYKLLSLSPQAKCILCHLQCFDFLMKKKKKNNMLKRSKLRTLIQLLGSILGIVFITGIRVTNLLKSMEMAYGN